MSEVTVYLQSDRSLRLEIQPGCISGSNASEKPEPGYSAMTLPSVCYAKITDTGLIGPSIKRTLNASSLSSAMPGSVFLFFTVSVVKCVVKRQR